MERKVVVVWVSVLLGRNRWRKRRGVCLVAARVRRRRRRRGKDGGEGEGEGEGEMVVVKGVFFCSMDDGVGDGDGGVVVGGGGCPLLLLVKVCLFV